MMGSLTSSVLLDLLAILTAFLAICFAYFKWTYQYWRRRNLPYFEPTIPFGNSSNPFNSKVPIGETVAEIYRKGKSKGWKHCGIFMMTSPVYVVIDLELVKHVLTKDFQFFADRGAYVNEKVDPIGCHLFALGGTRWRNLRTKLTPTFTSGKLKAMFQSLVDCGLNLEKYIQENVVNKEAIDIKDILQSFSIDVIGSCAFGLDCNSFKEPNSPFKLHGKKVFTLTRLEAVTRLICNNFPNLARALGFRQVSKRVSDFYTRVVEDVVAHRENNNYRRNDFLQLLIDIKNGEKQNESSDVGATLSMNELVAQSFVFLIAGFETSSTTMSFVLFNLATHPEVQVKVREEIQTVLGKHDDQITYDSITELKYLDQVIDETLRMYSPARILHRRCINDYKVPGKDVILEKGTRVIVPIKGIHYDEDIYENPNEFDPERFNEENKRKRHRYAHLPFGEGPRVCIGERFGVMQTKVGLTSILRKFKVTLSEKTKTPLAMSPTGVVSMPVGGIWLNVEEK